MKNPPLDDIYSTTKMEKKIGRIFYPLMAIYYLFIMGVFIHGILIDLYLTFWPDLLIIASIPFLPLGSWYYIKRFAKIYQIGLRKLRCNDCRKKIWGKYHYITTEEGTAKAVRGGVKMFFTAVICETCRKINKLRE